MPEETAHGSSTITRNGHVSFSELVRAHFEWDRASDPGVAESVRERFRALLDDFQDAAGEIVDAYWCRQEASAVALTRRERERRGALRRKRRLEYRLHRVSDWITGDVHEIADLLHDCDILAIKAANTLEGVQRAVVMQWLLLIESHLLGFIERHRETSPSPAEVRAFARSERAELRRVEDYYIRAGEKHARMRYVEGMLGFGFVLLFIAALITTGVLAIFGVLDDNPKLLREFYASAAAGALGAVVSVMLRMSGRGDFSVDHELGRWEIVLVGAYRPVIGSVCGVVAYFLVRTPFIPIDQNDLDLPLFVTVAFLAGFSERWMRTMLSGVQSIVPSGAHGDEDDARPETRVLEVTDVTVSDEAPSRAARH
jgi:hypothetical protein